MRRRLVVALAALSLVSSTPPAAAGDEGPLVRAAGAPAAPPPALREAVERLDTDPTFDFARLKQSLAPAEVSQQTLPPGPAPHPPGETVELTLDKSLEIALRRNLDIRIDELSQQALETEVARARATFHPLVGLALTRSRERTFPRAAKATELNSTQVTPLLST